MGHDNRRLYNDTGDVSEGLRLSLAELSDIDLALLEMKVKTAQQRIHYERLALDALRRAIAKDQAWREHGQV